jgi:hypothetical protein
MQFVRSCFFLASIAMAIPAVAADNADTAQPSSGQQATETATDNFDPHVLRTPFGMYSLSPHPLLEAARPVVARQFIAPGDRACLTLRIYKVKRTERLADNESGMRGYTTCEFASNYQVRSAVAHARDAQGSTIDAAGK